MFSLALKRLSKHFSTISHLCSLSFWPLWLGVKMEWAIIRRWALFRHFTVIGFWCNVSIRLSMDNQNIWLHFTLVPSNQIKSFSSCISANKMSWNVQKYYTVSYWNPRHLFYHSLMLLISCEMRSPKALFTIWLSRIWIL